MMATITAQSSISDTQSRKRKLDRNVPDSPRPAKRNATSPMFVPAASTTPMSRQISNQDKARISASKPPLSVKSELQTSQSLLGKSVLPTSPVSNSLSQTSLSSYNAGSPSTAPSSVILDDESGHYRTAADGKSTTLGKHAHEQQSAVNENWSRSPSAASVDGVGRSSGRPRKPTSKAKALADAGTKFFRNLQRSSEGTANADQTIPIQVIDISPEKDSSRKSNEADDYIEHEPPEASAETSILDSVESPSSTPVRSSSRQRKPTLKAVAAEAELASRKRTTSPADNDRASKVPRTGMTTPREPSKLRQSLSSVEDNAAEDIDEVAEISGEVHRAVPATEHAPIADDLAETALKTNTQHTACDLSCLSPATTILAFARYVADDEEAEDSGDEADVEPRVTTSTNVPDDDSTKMAKSTIKSIIQAYCSCSQQQNEAPEKDIATATNSSHGQLQDNMGQTFTSRYQKLSERSQDQTNPSANESKSGQQKVIRRKGKFPKPQFNSSAHDSHRLIKPHRDTSSPNPETIKAKGENAKLHESPAVPSKQSPKPGKAVGNRINLNAGDHHPIRAMHRVASREGQTEASPTSSSRMNTIVKDVGSPLKNTFTMDAHQTTDSKRNVTNTMYETISPNPNKPNGTSIILKTSANKKPQTDEADNPKTLSQKGTTSRTKAKAISRRSDILDDTRANVKKSSKSSEAGNLPSIRVNQNPVTSFKPGNDDAMQGTPVKRTEEGSTPSLKITLKVRTLPK